MRLVSLRVWLRDNYFYTLSLLFNTSKIIQVKKLFLLTIALVSLSILANAQAEPKLIAVVNKADWCHVCKANGEKMMKEVIPVFENPTIRFYMNDLTNEISKQKSLKELKETKAIGAIKKIKATGLIILINGHTGKLIDKISVAEPVATIVANINAAENQIEM